jgi:hypothetical protein
LGLVFLGTTLLLYWQAAVIICAVFGIVATIIIYKDFLLKHWGYAVFGAIVTITLVTALLSNGFWFGRAMAVILPIGWMTLAQRLLRQPTHMIEIEPIPSKHHRKPSSKGVSANGI